MAGLAVAFFFLGAVLVFWLYGRAELESAPLRLRRLLGTLRLIALLALTFIFTRPTITLRSDVMVAPRFPVLLDLSKSMQRADSLFRRDTGAGIRSWTNDLCKAIEARGGQAQLIPFDSEVRKPSSVGKGFTGVLTDPASALEYVRQLPYKRDVRAVIFLSDGLRNHGQDPTSSHFTLPWPVHTICFGDTAPQKDLRLEELDVKRIQYVGQEMVVRFSYQASNCAESSALVSLMINGKRVSTQNAILAAFGRTTQSEFRYTGAQAGELQIAVEFDGLHGEVSKTNNRLSSTVSILEKRKTIQLLAPNPSLDYRFLKGIMIQCPDMALTDTVFSSSKDAVYEPLDKALGWDSINLVILLDAGREQLAGAVETYVRDGGSVLFVGHLPTQEAWRPLMPFAQAGEPLLGDWHGVRMTETGHMNKITCGTGDLESFWIQVPPLTDVYKNHDPGPGTVVLLETIHGRVPVVAVRPYGKGITAFFFGHDVWKWHFAEAGGLADTLSKTQTQQFWERFITFMANSRERRRFRIIPLKSEWLLGEDVRWIAEIYDETFQPLKQVEMEMNIQAPGRSPLHLRFTEDADNIYRHGFRPVISGLHSFCVIANRQGVKVDSVNGVFHVLENDLEYSRPAPDTEWMRRLARVSGGQSYSVNQASELLQALNYDGELRENVQTLEPWRHWIALLFIVAALSAEWWIRKRRRME